MITATLSPVSSLAAQFPAFHPLPLPSLVPEWATSKMMQADAATSHSFSEVAG